MYTGPLRLLRALTVSATCVALSFAAHLFGAGSAVPMISVVSALGLLMTTVLLTLVLAALSGQRWTLGRALVALALGQGGLDAVFRMLLISHHVQDPAGISGIGDEMPMVLAHGVAALLIGLCIAVNDQALDTYFSLTTSPVGSGIALVSPWRLARLIASVPEVAAVRATGLVGLLIRWARPRIQTDLVALQCLSRRGPPALALAS
jgi:hypothetical protein